MSPPQRSTKSSAELLATFPSSDPKYQILLQALNSLLDASFNAMVYSHINDQIRGLDYDAKISRLASYHNFPAV